MSFFVVRQRIAYEGSGTFYLIPYDPHDDISRKHDTDSVIDCDDRSKIKPLLSSGHEDVQKAGDDAICKIGLE